jgi:hypothetical protein
VASSREFHDGYLLEKYSSSSSVELKSTEIKRRLVHLCNSWCNKIGSCSLVGTKHERGNYSGRQRLLTGNSCIDARNHPGHRDALADSLLRGYIYNCSWRLISSQATCRLHQLVSRFRAHSLSLLRTYSLHSHSHKSAKSVVLTPLDALWTSVCIAIWNSKLLFWVSDEQNYWSTGRWVTIDKVLDTDSSS